ncbi:hypothetical protein D3C81_1510560 [compost metagenome]
MNAMIATSRVSSTRHSDPSTGLSARLSWSRFSCNKAFSSRVSHLADAMSRSSLHSTSTPSSTHGRPDIRNSQCQPARPSTPSMVPSKKPAAGPPTAPAKGTARNHSPFIFARCLRGNQQAR